MPPNVAGWHFRRIQPGETVVEPTQGQFFHQDVISGSAVRGIVREGIQNALDAKSEPPVTVRIALMRGKHACSPSAASRIFGPEMWGHVTAKQNGLRPDALPEMKSLCDYLVFEDFGTTGLTGDIRQYVRRDGKGSDFFNFFRAAGSTDKRGNKLGKWGIGKHTFWMASRINTVFGLSVREGDGMPVLMGKTILKSHAVAGSRNADHQDGYYGWREDDSAMVLPLGGENPLAEFRKAFSLRRKNEPGLSLVVPWAREKIREVGKESLISEVARDYFYPILTGRLTVRVEADGGEVVLDAENIGDNVPDPEVARRIRLARWMQGVSDGQRCKIRPKTSYDPEWAADMFGDSLGELVETFRNGREIALRVQVSVTPKGKAGAYSTRRLPSHFDIALVKGEDESGAGEPCFIREGIIIPRVGKSRTAKNITALVVAEEGALADFLGDSENPSHTEWQRELLTDKYSHVGKVLDFVCGSVRNVVRIFTQADQQRDREILADIFPLLAAGEKQRKKRESVAPPPPRPPQCHIRKIQRGFSVASNSKRALPVGALLTVRVAYRVRRGSPLDKYDPDDFQLQGFDRGDKGLRIIEVSNNVALAEITEEDFLLSFRGFDQNRDLFVEAKVGER